MAGCVLLLATARMLNAADARLTFNEHIRPILSDNCFACHGTDAKKRKGDLRLDLADGAYRLDDDGVAAIKPGDLAKSELWRRITSDDPDELMPPPKSHKPPLSVEQRALIKRWIEQGAVYQRHWAYEPVRRPELPPATDSGTHPVDRFIEAKLAAHGLSLAPEAQREVLLRRVTLDLTGLPPTIDEINAFMADPAPDAYERARRRPPVEFAALRRASVARSWLDAARYADTHGLHFDNERTIWPYRDWVVRALNDNLPFDQFTLAQLAGDLLPQPTQDQLIASGFNRCQLTTNEGGSIEDEVLARYTSDRTDTVAGVWLGLTANCASCHDHKFDPLKQREYYQLGAFFRGLADRVFDANARVPGPFILVANPEQQRHVQSLARQLTAATAKVSARAEQFAETQPALSSKPVTYEVVWAEDGDVPTPEDFSGPKRAGEWREGDGVPLAGGRRALRRRAPWSAPTPEDFSGPKRAGEWREGDGVPLAGGRRALRLEGTVEREIKFGAGDVRLLVRTALQAFAHVYLDRDKPPRAVGIEFIDAGHKARRVVWGDAKALGANSVVAGPLPLPGAYVRLEADALAAGLEKGGTYTGIRLLQSDGAAWWDHIGAVCTSPNAAEDPLLSVKAWKRDFVDEDLRTAADLPIDVKYSIRLADYFQNDDDRRRLAEYHRNFVYGPLRGALEPEAEAARKLLAEQIHLEKTLPATLVSREMAEPHPAFILLRGQYDKHGDAVGPATPAFLPPLQSSGTRPTRLDLARWIVAKENPLTARVTVNRLWQQFFGAGLVRTPGDFGAQGEPPTHPELLDWLASEFVDGGWNVKQLVRAARDLAHLSAGFPRHGGASRLGPGESLTSPADRASGSMVRFCAIRRSSWPVSCNPRSVGHPCGLINPTTSGSRWPFPTAIPAITAATAERRCIVAAFTPSGSGRHRLRRWSRSMRLRGKRFVSVARAHRTPFASARADE